MKVLEDVGFASGVPQNSELSRWKAHLLRNRDRLIQATALDTKRSPDECFLLEWGPVENALDFLEDMATDVMGPRPLRSSFKAFLGNRMLCQRRLPVGNVLIVGTWNFPMALHLAQILFARAAGNSVTFKASPLSPELSKVLQEVLSEIWTPAEFRMWQPEAAEDVLTAIRAREYQLVLFTGGTASAQVFAKVCGEAMVPFIPEASGSEAAIVVGHRSPGAIREDVDHLLWALFHHSGQTCVAPRYWFVPEAVAKDYYLLAGQYLTEAANVTASRAPLKNAAVEKEHGNWLHWVSEQNPASQYHSETRGDFSVFLANSSEFSAESPATFGPGAVIIPYSGVAQAVAWVKKTPWSLMTTIMGEPSAAEQKDLLNLDASIIALNEAVTSVGDAAIPFGGRGQSGYGVTHGIDGLMQLSRSQTWVEVRAWPGLSMLRPSFRKLLKLNDAGVWMKDLDASPIKTAKNLLARVLSK